MDGGEPARITAIPFTEHFFRVLGLQPRIGRLFSSEECQPNGPSSVLLDHRFWQRRFDADPSILGRAIVLDGGAAVVGVLPAIGARVTVGEIVDKAWRRNAFRPVLSPLRDRITGRFRSALFSVCGGYRAVEPSGRSSSRKSPWSACCSPAPAC